MSLLLIIGHKKIVLHQDRYIMKLIGFLNLIFNLNEFLFDFHNNPLILRLEGI